VPTHLFVAHAPFVLILTGAAIDLFGALTRSDERRRWAGTLLILGSAAALLAFFTGSAALVHAFSRPQADHGAIEAHSQWAGAGVWLLVIAGGLRAAWRFHVRGLYGWINLALAVLSGLLVVGITISGIRIAHGG